MFHSRIECPDWCRHPGLHQDPDYRQAFVSHTGPVGSVGALTIDLSRTDVVHDGATDEGDVYATLNLARAELDAPTLRALADELLRVADVISDPGAKW